ncbi:TonB-dependent receptor plug domain-containing protein [Algoriphagus halophilus]|uniref:TonB-dependent receptor plug domain-containing protein n=1 Tax=Algoriphagus halophilus TaxID=226505 RepID=UPI00358FC2D3
MNAVDNMGLYEAKKSEVILPENMTANLSTNNARQVYSKVVGLNIWENDGAGLQLSIGGRGLDPNRSSNFNTRQNGYDISADALGYPESYYTPPLEGIGKIQIVRGAASLQYGTQFGGLVNFQMKRPVEHKKWN